MKRPYNILAAIGLNAPFTALSPLPLIWLTPWVSLGWFFHMLALGDGRHYLIGYWIYVLISIYWLVDVCVNMGHMPWLVSLICIMMVATLVTSFHLFLLKTSRSFQPMTLSGAFVISWVGTECFLYLLNIPILSITATAAWSPFFPAISLCGISGFAILMCIIVSTRHYLQWLCIASLLLLSFIPAVLPHQTGEMATVAVIQPNDESNVKSLLTSYQHNDIALWPESSIPFYAIDSLKYHITAPNHNLVFGTVKPDENGYHNIIVQFHQAQIHQQQKQHLVPFGETLFLESLPQSIGQWLNTQFNDFLPFVTLLSKKPIKEEPFVFKNGVLTPYICYDSLFFEPSSDHNYSVNLIINNNIWYPSNFAKRWLMARYRMVAYASMQDTIVSSNTGYSAVIKPINGTTHMTYNTQENVIEDHVTLYKTHTIWSYGIDHYFRVLLLLVIVLLVLRRIVDHVKH